MYKFLTDDELIDLSIRKKKKIKVWRVTHEIISKDTVDINFGLLDIHCKLENGIKLVSYSISCGRTRGYQHGIRFVLSNEEKKWTIISNQFVVTTK